MKFVSLFFLSLLSLPLIGMEKQAAKTNPASLKGLIDISMIKINKWQDIVPFANRIVAYTTNNPRFGSWKGYPLSDDTRLKYGYIIHSLSRSGEGAHSITQLLNLTDTPSCQPLKNDVIKDSSLYMRLANADEINKIHEIIQSSKGEFEYVFDKNQALYWLQESIVKLPKPILSLRDLSMDAAVILLITRNKAPKELKVILPAELYEEIEKKFKA